MLDLDLSHNYGSSDQGRVESTYSLYTKASSSSIPISHMWCNRTYKSLFKLKPITKVGRILYPNMNCDNSLFDSLWNYCSKYVLKILVNYSCFSKNLEGSIPKNLMILQWIFYDNLQGNFELKIKIFAHNVWISNKWL